MGGLWRVVFACVPLLLGSAATAQGERSQGPRRPRSRRHRGRAVTTGLDYTHPDIAARLARDGEGGLIGWDFMDDDNRPFAAKPAQAAGEASEGTELARLLLAVYARARLVPVRINPDDPVSVAEAVAFVRAHAGAHPVDPVLGHGARGLGAVPAGGRAARQGAAVRASRRRGLGPRRDLAGGVRCPMPLRSRRHRLRPRIGGRVCRHARQQPVRSARQRPRRPCGGGGIRRRPCGLRAAQPPAADPATARAALLALGQPAEGVRGAIVLDPVCFYGGQRL